MMEIRSYRNEDRDAIVELHREAFGQQEGEEVAALAIGLQADPTAKPILSLLAEENGQVLGHVLFTAVNVVDGGKSVPGRVLAPVGVLPVAQGKGIGGRLIRAGLEQLRASGAGLVFVLGHPSYYPRFGFEPAGRLGLHAPYPIPDKVADAWMVQELEPGLLGKVKGTVQCAEVLSHPEHWRE